MRPVKIFKRRLARPWTTSTSLRTPSSPWKKSSKAPLLRSPPQAVDPADLDQQNLSNPWQDAESTEDRVARREQLALVQAALRKLPERDQRIMGLYYEEELTLEEIGMIINVSQSRVSQLIGKVKRKLRAELAEAA